MARQPYQDLRGSSEPMPLGVWIRCAGAGGAGAGLAIVLAGHRDAIAFFDSRLGIHGFLVLGQRHAGGEGGEGNGGSSEVTGLHGGFPSRLVGWLTAGPTSRTMPDLWSAS